MKQKEIEKIAKDLDRLSEKYHDPILKEAAALLRKSLALGKSKSNDQSTEEGDAEGNGGIEVPKKPPPPQP